MTGKDVCETWIRSQYPHMTEEEVITNAVAFWNRDPSGGLLHVYHALEILQNQGILPKMRGGQAT